ATTLVPSNANVTTTTIKLTTPAGSGTVAVTVETPNGVSNPCSFNYVQGTVPISFTAPTTVATLTSPTQAAWGPDGRLYVASDQGNIRIYTFADDYTVTNTQVVTTIASLLNPSILGLAFNPRDPSSPVKLYVAHSHLYAEGGGSFTGTAPYNGQVSVLTGPGFSTVKPLITRLPVANLDHAINGMTFNDVGDLLIANGSATNAGVPSVKMGTLPESPLSGAILKAQLSKSVFNGAISYIETATGKVNNDQVFGDLVDVAPGVDVTVFAPGLRNPWDIVWTTGGKLYGSDNGQNTSFGPLSTSATTSTIALTDAPDEINYLVQGRYYGHPNRNRGRYDSRQNIYHWPTDPITTNYVGTPLVTVASSSDGIDEYRATTFNSRMRGNLLVQKWKGVLYRGVLAADGQSLQSVTTLASTLGLDVVAGPGGAILSSDYTNNKLVVIKPIDSAATGMVAYDIFPWRARADGSTTFVIGGAHFGTLAGTTVKIGGVAATLTSVSATRIKGTIPANSAPTAQLLDVVVQSAGTTATISQAFRYN
ncbi:MAG: IPT/TIG domain-containing protein, partial [Chthoniobacterales bacterium]